MATKTKKSVYSLKKKNQCADLERNASSLLIKGKHKEEAYQLYPVVISSGPNGNDRQIFSSSFSPFFCCLISVPVSLCYFHHQNTNQDLKKRF
jgi:hypothetical protein